MGPLTPHSSLQNKHAFFPACGMLITAQGRGQERPAVGGQWGSSGALRRSHFVFPFFSQLV